MFGRIGQEFQCLEEKDQNYEVWKDRVRIPMFGRRGPEFYCLKGEGQNFWCLEVFGQNSNVWKDKVKFESLEG